jgi:hypothetical protein
MGKPLFRAIYSSVRAKRQVGNVAALRRTSRKMSFSVNGMPGTSDFFVRSLQHTTTAKPHWGLLCTAIRFHV